MIKIPNHTALKEWSDVIDALGRGDQVVLIRKGGIADPSFGVEAERFYLYPTYYHQPSAAAEPEVVTISHWCEVVASWRVTALETLYRLESQVVMPRQALETRYRFRPDQALHILGVRTHQLAEAVTIAVRPSYVGCRSWISIDDEIAIDGSAPCLSESVLRARFDEVQQLLAEAG